jgi:hypothetical protein
VADQDGGRSREIVRRLRTAWAVEVLELPGCYDRGAAWTRTPTGLVDHHDASTRKSGEWGALGVIRDGRSDVPGPLASWQGARCLDGTPRVALVAAGRGNHAGLGGPMAGATKNAGNAFLVGVEWANDGVGEAFTAAAHYAHDALFRCIAEVCGFPITRVIGHKEWAPGRKSDPPYSMAWRRGTVAAAVPRGSAPAARPLLRQGSTGDAVRTVQAFLRRVFPSYAGALVVDGAFGPATTAAVTEFQRRTGLSADGVIGPATWAKLASHGYR